MKLQDVCVLFTDGDWIESKDQSNKGIRLVQTGNIGIGEYLKKEGREKYIAEETFEELKCTEIYPGDILVSRLPEPVGRGCIIPETNERMITAVDCTICRINEDLLDKRYFCYYLQSAYYYNQLKKSVTGTTRKRISRKNLGNVEIKIPNRTRQLEIVNVLDKITLMIHSRKQQLQQLDELVKARFVEMFGDVESKVPISCLCNVSGGYSFKSSDITHDGDIRILQIGNVYIGNVNWDTVNYLPKGYGEIHSRFLLNKGDIVIALTRPIIQSLGNAKACIVQERDIPCLLNQRVGRISSRSDKNVSLEFVYGCLMTDEFTRYVESCCIGCSQPNISTKDIDDYLIPDVSFEEQMKYVQFKEQVDKSKFAVQQSLDKLETLKKSLMQKYFG